MYTEDAKKQVIYANTFSLCAGFIPGSTPDSSFGERIGRTVLGPERDVRFDEPAVAGGDGTSAPMWYSEAARITRFPSGSSEATATRGFVAVMAAAAREAGGFVSGPDGP